MFYRAGNSGGVGFLVTVALIDAAWLLSLLTLRWRGPSPRPAKPDGPEADLGQIPPAIRALVACNLRRWREPVYHALFADLVRRGRIEVGRGGVRVGAGEEHDRLVGYERVLLNVVSRLEESRGGAAPSLAAVERSMLFGEAIRRGLIRRMRFRAALAHGLTAFGLILAVFVAGAVTDAVGGALHVGAAKFYWIPLLFPVFLIVFILQLRPAAIAAVAATNDTEKLTPLGAYVSQAVARNAEAGDVLTA
jgi:hypothetical protein